MAGDADAASQGTIDDEQLEHRPLLRPAEVLEVIPGVVVTQATNRTASGGITLGGERGWTGGLRLRYFGPRALIEDNSQRSQSSTLVNAKLGYAFNKQVRLNAEVLNLTNNKVNDIEYLRSRLKGEGRGMLRI